MTDRQFDYFGIMHIVQKILQSGYQCTTIPLVCSVTMYHEGSQAWLRDGNRQLGLLYIYIGAKDMFYFALITYCVELNSWLMSCR